MWLYSKFLLPEPNSAHIPIDIMDYLTIEKMICFHTVQCEAVVWKTIEELIYPD